MELREEAGLIVLNGGLGAAGMDSTGHILEWMRSGTLEQSSEDLVLVEHLIRRIVRSTVLSLWIAAMK